MKNPDDFERVHGRRSHKARELRNETWRRCARGSLGTVVHMCAKKAAEREGFFRAHVGEGQVTKPKKLRATLCVALIRSSSLVVLLFLAAFRPTHHQNWTPIF